MDKITRTTLRQRKPFSETQTVYWIFFIGVTQNATGSKTFFYLSTFCRFIDLHYFLPVTLTMLKPSPFTLNSCPVVVFADYKSC